MPWYIPGIGISIHGDLYHRRFAAGQCSLYGRANVSGNVSGTLDIFTVGVITFGDFIEA